MTSQETKAAAARWAGSACTLDGRPARVLGRLQRFATVATIPGGAAVEFSWAAVGRIMGKGGGFKS